MLSVLEPPYDNLKMLKFFSQYGDVMMCLLSHKQSQNDKSVLRHGTSQKRPLLLITTDSMDFPSIAFQAPWPFL